MQICILKNRKVVDCLSLNNLGDYDVGQIIKESLEKNGKDTLLIISNRFMSSPEKLVKNAQETIESKKS